MTNYATDICEMVVLFNEQIRVGSECVTIPFDRHNPTAPSQTVQKLNYSQPNLIVNLKMEADKLHM